MPAARSMRLVPYAAVLLSLGLPLLPGVPEHLVNLAVLICIGSLVALGLVILTGVGGMTSFGQAVFVGLGAYTTGVLTTTHGWSPWATFVPALIVTGLGALLVGSVTVRLSGHFLALGTVAWGMAVYTLFGSLPMLGHHTGISGIPPLRVGTYAIDGARSYYVVAWTALFVCVVLTLNLLDSRSGRAVRALRGGGQIAQAFCVNAPRAKLGLFVYAALLAGISGWLLAHFHRAISPALFGLGAGVEYLLMAVIGGAGQVFGAVLGAAIVVVLREQLQIHLPRLLGQNGSFETVVFGAVLVIMLLAGREGLWPLIARRLHRSPAGDAARPVAESNASLPKRAMPARGAPLITAEGLSKNFGGLVAVNGVSFSVGAGEILGLIGPNGAGKSTTFGLLTGSVSLSAGTVRCQNEVFQRPSPGRAAALGIARTFQHVKLIAAMSVLDNVAIGAHLRGARGPIAAMLRLDREEERLLMAEAARQIDRVGLGDCAQAPAGSLPLGRMRLVEIARALAMDPVLLLLDEPAAGLRYHEKVQLANVLRALSKEGMTVLLVEHDMDFVMNLVDRLVVLDFGTRIAEGAPRDVRRDPAVVAAYLGPQA